MIKTWNDCDNMLREIALIDIAASDADGTRKQTIIDAELEYKKATAPSLAKRETLVEELEGFYRSRRKEVETSGKRSLDLNFGRLGMRLGKPTLALAKGWKWDRVLAAIKERWSRNTDLLKALITTKESVNKDVVKSRLNEEDLAMVGLRVKQGDEFFFETFPDKAKDKQAA